LKHLLAVNSVIEVETDFQGECPMEDINPYDPPAEIKSLLQANSWLRSAYVGLFEMACIFAAYALALSLSIGLSLFLWFSAIGFGMNPIWITPLAVIIGVLSFFPLLFYWLADFYARYAMVAKRIREE
jgi:hypothetical protein